MTEIVRVAVLVGSLRQASFNRRLALAVAALAPPEFVFEHIAIGDLPHYNQDNDKNLPEEAKRLKREIERCNALLFVTPEYNRSISGVLKNAIDTASRPYGTNSFAGKPAGVIGISVSPVGTAAAQQHLRPILGYLDVPTLGQPEVFIKFEEELIDENGAIGREDTKKFLQKWVDRYVAWVHAHPPAGKT